ncbi:hypothetical protein AK812_SmicGene12316 [Symbiodinium microadriaticum]|uniref:Uncharacterized protein n=1 Tax=Symbiodinium microadriaticum TaxID=2951 RepID=A0A1Q9EB08_SYMMI|nr:hypothetical protein AK812_SmicGene12316 [Symbiodinium microadriaticum]
MGDRPVGRSTTPRDDSKRAAWMLWDPTGLAVFDRVSDIGRRKAAAIRKSFQRPKLWVTGYHQGEYGSESLKEACSLVLCFLAGAYTCGILIDKNQVHFLGKAFYGMALVLNSALLVLAAFVPGVLVPTCFVAAACGLQNAMCTSHFGAIIRTTHVTGTVTDIGSTMGRISMIWLRRAINRTALNDIDRAEIAVDTQKLTVLAGLWVFYLSGGIYMENVIPGPKALLVPASVTGSIGLFYMACRQLLKVELDKEMDHMIEALHEVEADFENVCYQQESRRFDRQVVNRIADGQLPATLQTTLPRPHALPTLRRMLCLLVLYSAVIIIAGAVNFFALLPAAGLFESVEIALYNSLVALLLACHICCMTTNPGRAKDFVDQVKAG